MYQQKEMNTPNMIALAQDILLDSFRVLVSASDYPRIRIAAQDSGIYPLYCNAALALSKDPSEQQHTAQTFCLKLMQKNPVMLGVEMLESADASNGYINFSLSAACYDKLLLTVLEQPEYEYPPEAAEALKKPVYALQRMKMLTRTHRSESLCPDAQEARLALWSILGIVGALGNKELLLLRLNTAAGALLDMLTCVLPKYRREWHDAISNVADAGARMLSMGLWSYFQK